MNDNNTVNDNDDNDTYLQHPKDTIMTLLSSSLSSSTTTTTILPFASPIPNTDTVQHDEDVEEKSSSDMGIVGTITLFGTTTAMIWIGWGKIHQQQQQQQHEQDTTTHNNSDDQNKDIPIGSGMLLYIDFCIMVFCLV
jgi:hypothetical protein